MKTIAIAFLLISSFFLDNQNDVLREKGEIYKKYDLALKSSTELNKPILMLFNANNCKNPQLTSELLKSSTTIEKALDNFVFVYSLVDDKTPTYKIERKHGTQKGLSQGHYNSTFQKEKFNTNYSPFYAILDSSGSTLITSGFLETEVALLNFLKEGVLKFK